VHREAKIYAVYALLGVALFLYATSFAFTAWERLGASVTFAVYAFTALLFAFFTALGIWLAFILSKRSITSIDTVIGGFDILPINNQQRESIRVQHLRHLRTIGKQFARDESTPAFAIFAAAGRVWVAEASVYQAAKANASQ